MRVRSQEGGQTCRLRQPIRRLRPAAHIGRHIRPRSSRRSVPAHRSVHARDRTPPPKQLERWSMPRLRLACHPDARAGGCQTSPRLRRRWHRIRLRPSPRHCRRIHCHSCVRWCCRIRIPRSTHAPIDRPAHRSAWRPREPGPPRDVPPIAGRRLTVHRRAEGRCNRPGSSRNRRRTGRRQSQGRLEHQL